MITEREITLDQVSEALFNLHLNIKNENLYTTLNSIGSGYGFW